MLPFAAFGFCLASQSSGAAVVDAPREAEYLAGRLSVKISLSPKLRNEILLICGPRDPEKELQAVAAALHASVTKTPDGLFIERTDSERDAIKKALIKWRTGWMKNDLDAIKEHRERRLHQTTVARAVIGGIESFADSIEHMKPFPPTEPQSALQLMPSTKLLEDLIRRIGLEKFAAIPSGTQKIYETRPVCSSEPLPEMNDLADEYRTTMRNLAALPLSKDAQKWLNTPAMDELASLLTLQNSPGTNPTTFRLEANSSGIEMRFALDIYSLDGRRIDGARLSLGQRPVSAPAPELKRPVSGEVLLSDEAAANVQVAAIPFLHNAIPAWLADPAGHEPLSMIAAPALQAYIAPDPDRLVVADLPDWMFYIASRSVVKKSLELNVFARRLEERGDYEEVSTSDADVWRPNDPSEEEALRAPRESLAKFMEEVRSDRSLNPRTLGALYERPFPVAWPLSEIWVGNASVNFNAGYPGNTTHTTLALIGAMSEANWRQLQTGAKMTVDELDVGPQMEAILQEDMSANMSRIVTSKPPEIVTRALLCAHPAELYAGKSVGDTRVWLTGVADNAYRSWDPVTKALSDEWLPIDELADAFDDCLPVISHAAPEDLDSLRPQFEKNALRVQISVGRQVRMSIQFGLPQGYLIEEHLPAHYESTSQVIGYSDLPVDVQESAWRAACTRARERGEG